jgi:phospholipase C
MQGIMQSTIRTMRSHSRATLAGKFLSACILFALIGCSSRADASAGQRATSSARSASPAAISGQRVVPRSTGQPISTKLQYVVVIYLENHSFDNLYGEFDGANGLSNSARTATQVDRAGKPFEFLPTPPGGAFPRDLPNKPFDIEKYIPLDAKTPDLVHRYYQEQEQIDGGKMDKFAAISDAKGLVMGYYHTGNLPLVIEAQRNTLCDNFFHAAFGGSFLNHLYFISTRAPVFPNAPERFRAKLDDHGNRLRDGEVTPDGYVVNTMFTVNSPHPRGVPTDALMPEQTFATIGDRLSDKHVTWAWYSGGWDDAIAGHPDRLFQYHHQPFAYFANYADGTPGREEHLKDEGDFIAAAHAGKLPSVSFVKPLGELNEHPGYANVKSGEDHAEELLNILRSTPEWKSMAVIVTYDENGGFWDHVAPPVIDKWGPGSRVPALVISPFAKHGYVDHTFYDTSSILALIEHRWGLEPLTERDAKANDMRGAFDFNQ